MKKIKLGILELNYEDLYSKGIIRKVGKNYRVRIYFEQPDFYIGLKKSDPNRLTLAVKYCE